jgi:hypothetical protein
MGDGSGKWWNSDNGPCNTPNPCSDDGGAPGGGGPKDGLGNPNNGGGDPNPRNSRSLLIHSDGNAPYARPNGQPLSSTAIAALGGSQSIFARAKELYNQGSSPISALNNALKERGINDTQNININSSGQIDAIWGVKKPWGLQIRPDGTVVVTSGGYLLNFVCEF